jgi:hypothetical protein
MLHISEIKVGDSVLHNGKVMTVGPNDIKGGGFMGRTLFGDSYRLGGKLVTVVCFDRALPVL